MELAVKIQSNDFAASEVRDVVGVALSNERSQAQIRRDYFAKLCKDFETEHRLSSDEFIRRFDGGELGDDAYLFDWFAAKRSLDLWQRRYQILSGLTL